MTIIERSVLHGHSSLSAEQNFDLNCFFLLFFFANEFNSGFHLISF